MVQDEFDYSEWEKLVEYLENCLARTNNPWTLSTKSDQYEFGPYVQARYDRLWIYGEITSNKYLKPPIDEFMHPYMWELGWFSPADKSFPNFNCRAGNSEAGRKKMAKLWVRTLVEVYGMTDEWLCEYNEILPSGERFEEL